MRKHCLKSLFEGLGGGLWGIGQGMDPSAWFSLGRIGISQLLQHRLAPEAPELEQQGEYTVLERLCKHFISLSTGKTSVCKTLSGLLLSAVGAGGEGEPPQAAGSWEEARPASISLQHCWMLTGLLVHPLGGGSQSFCPSQGEGSKDEMSLLRWHFGAGNLF